MLDSHLKAAIDALPGTWTQAHHRAVDWVAGCRWS
jgi:hypothetical protein